VNPGLYCGFRIEVWKEQCQCAVDILNHYPGATIPRLSGMRLGEQYGTGVGIPKVG
jgi:hypothetical protein